MRRGDGGVNSPDRGRSGFGKEFHLSGQQEPLGLPEVSRLAQAKSR
ncbi:hypothetical protein [Gemmobacter sp. 24YEA27]|nr:hypothetical protein [Gemmobacter sp. 24YEA27]